MKMSKKEFSYTRRKLTAQAREHKRQLDYIRSAQVTLACNNVTFEVHFQCYSPSHRAVSVFAKSLSVAYEKASVTWKRLNGKSNCPGRPSADVFVRAGRLIVPLQPQDAVLIANNEVKSKKYTSAQFSLDDRLLKPVGQVVWRREQQLPGWHAQKAMAA